MTISLEEFIEKYNNLDSGTVLEDVTLSVAGMLSELGKQKTSVIALTKTKTRILLINI